MLDQENCEAKTGADEKEYLEGGGLTKVAEEYHGQSSREIEGVVMNDPFIIAS